MKGMIEVERDIVAFYGVWLPGKGFLKVRRTNDVDGVFSSLKREIAAEVARNIGNGAQVRYIDNSIVDLEPLMLANEAKTVRYKLWRIWKNF